MLSLCTREGVTAAELAARFPGAELEDVRRPLRDLLKRGLVMITVPKGVGVWSLTDAGAARLAKQAEGATR